MRLVGIIQCRMSSTRLPDKAKAILRGRTALDWVIRRSLRASSLGCVILATTRDPEDDLVTETADNYGLPIFRGEKDNVLDRYVQIIKQLQPEAVVRITADNPLTDPLTLDRLADYFFDQRLSYGYAAQIPYGAGTDIFCSKNLLEIAETTNEPRHLEHINTFFLDNHLKYRIASLPAEKENRRPDVRITLDTKEDLDRLQAIFNGLEDPELSELHQIIELFDRLPESMRRVQA